MHNLVFPLSCLQGHLGITGGKVSKSNAELLNTSQAVGVEELLNILKNYCRVGEAKHIITVGIVGFPNVGKSSLINSLTRSRSVGVSPMPGFTKVRLWPYPNPCPYPYPYL
ncbi:hypothetical protein EON63_23830 [archaeon]|nr:MAG: hypothetical protein EON63_23830 [archaeon]